MKDEKQNNASANGSSSGNGSSSQSQNQNQAATADIASEMRGNFTFADGKITLPALNYRVPGADIAMHGVYNLHDQSLDFSGLARLDAHISQMVTGWKSWLLKPVDPFFAKNGAGTQVPIKVGGTTSHPDIGLDFGHKDKDKNHKAPASGSQTSWPLSLRPSSRGIQVWPQMFSLDPTLDPAETARFTPQQEVHSSAVQESIHLTRLTGPQSTVPTHFEKPSEPYLTGPLLGS